MKIIVLFLGFLLNFVESNAFNNQKDTVTVNTRFKKDVENANDSDYIFVCGDEFMETKCKCDKTYLNSNEIENLNIHIIAENFTVKSANFKNNGITVLKKKLILPGREYSVENLNFEMNKISSIANGAFDEFKKLENLTLSENLLKRINENVLTESLGKTLIHLDLKNTKLQKITSKTFENMKELKFLSLSMNPALMPYFNKNIFSTSLMNLKQLDLTWCNISTLENDVFINLINLERLDFHKNPITTVPKAFKLLPNLQILDFSHNPITVMEKAYFPYIPNLKELHLIGMENLTTINDCAFCNFPNLEKISLSFNDHLTFLHENAFGSISSGKLYSKIKEIDIIVPKLPSISERLVDWSKTDKFRFRTKIYICDCSIAWLINDLHRTDSIFLQKISLISEKCINPPELVIISRPVPGGNPGGNGNGNPVIPSRRHFSPVEIPFSRPAALKIL